MKKLVDFLTSRNFYMSLIVIFVFIILYFIIKKIINKYISKNKERIDKKKVTYFRLLKNIIKYVFIFILIAIILEINGIDVTGIIAGLGVVSVIAGLALQDALKDIIMGFNLIIDEYFVVGDIIKIGDIEGTVISLGLKNTKIKDVNFGYTYVIANRNITDALVINNNYLIDIDIPFEYELSFQKAESVINKIKERLENEPTIKKVEFEGINSFEASSINYKLFIYPDNSFKAKVKRNALSIIKKVLEEENITIPYTKIDIQK